MVGGRESDYSVCPRPLLQFLQFFQFMSDRLRQVMQVTSGYVILNRWDGMWSSTIREGGVVQDVGWGGCWGGKVMVRDR